MDLQKDIARRTVLKGAAGAGLAIAGSGGIIQAISGITQLGPSTTTAGTVYDEVYPVSPLIMTPFVDPLPIPRALAPVPKATVDTWSEPPGSDQGQQDSDHCDYPGMSTHQVWPSKIGSGDPLVYQIDLKVAGHRFTSSRVRPINNKGQQARPTGVTLDAQGLANLPESTIYGFDGTFPGPMINAEYGRPVLIRFRNLLDDNPYNLPRQDFGDPEHGFLTHLHNGHTAPESDGNPHYRMLQTMAMGITGDGGHVGLGGYRPGSWVDNLYLNWPAGNDSREKQSFFWFHDHRMDHTGANVYKGMVGLYPIYDPDMDNGDETRGYRLPGVRRDNADGSFDVDYDIPLALYDVRLDDGVTVHRDFHDGTSKGVARPEWWGRSFYKHFPDKGFVGDVFTVNGTAYPQLEVKRRRYRLRFLDASVARIYELKLMSSTQGPKSAYSLGYAGAEAYGQYRIPDGQQCMRFLQVATDGGLIQTPFHRDSFELWPAKRREVVVDFSRYMDGTPTKKGDVIYLTNVMKMGTGRMWDSSSRFSPDKSYKVPMMKIVIGDDAEDNSQVPARLREVPPFPFSDIKSVIAEPHQSFVLQRGSSSASPEIEWLINNTPFDPTIAMAAPKVNSYQVWEIKNGGGGWVHPLHLHMEEHRVIARNGKAVTAGDAGHPDDISREDVVALDPGESVLIGRYFRDFVGPYVGHCHNLAHEDHAMMFGFEIEP
jgi:FtsP/CotA-like multicopper oxidase with cupredoxin domain